MKHGGGNYRVISARALEQRWLEEAREYRLSLVHDHASALRFMMDFGLRDTDHKKVYALKKEALSDEILRLGLSVNWFAAQVGEDREES